MTADCRALFIFVGMTPNNAFVSLWSRAWRKLTIGIQRRENVKKEVDHITLGRFRKKHVWALTILTGTVMEEVSGGWFHHHKKIYIKPQLTTGMYTEIHTVLEEYNILTACSMINANSNQNGDKWRSSKFLIGVTTYKKQPKLKAECGDLRYTRMHVFIADVFGILRSSLTAPRYCEKKH